jgi:hypothetical protein
MPLTGVWVNEHKSVMAMSKYSVGSLGGTFRSLKELGTVRFARGQDGQRRTRSLPIGY